MTLKMEQLTKTAIAKLKRKQAVRGKPRESAIEQRICDYASSIGLVNRKYKTPGRASAPDRIFLPGNGLCFFMEVKRPGEVPTPAQNREHDRLRQQGYTVFVCDTVESGKAAIDRWFVMRGLR